MNAKQLYDKLKVGFTNHYFVTPAMADMERVINDTQYPCLVVTSLKRQPKAVAGHYKFTEPIFVAYLQKMDLDYDFEEAYDLVIAGEDKLLGAIYPMIDDVSNLDTVSEYNKFSENVAFSCITFDLTYNSKCPENM